MVGSTGRPSLVGVIAALCAASGRAFVVPTPALLSARPTSASAPASASTAVRMSAGTDYVSSLPGGERANRCLSPRFVLACQRTLMVHLKSFSSISTFCSQHSTHLSGEEVCLTKRRLTLILTVDRNAVAILRRQYCSQRQFVGFYHARPLKTKTLLSLFVVSPQLLFQMAKFGTP